jgi:hypothetical protein
MVSQVPFEVSCRLRLVAGSKAGRRSPIEVDVSEATGAQDGWDVLVPHVFLQLGCKGWIYLQGDFIEDH